MCSSQGNAALPALGCPIREPTDHRPFNAFPWLFAVVHALLRLQMPRHPPCALTILTVITPDGRKSLRCGDTRAIGRAPDRDDVGCCAVFKVREERGREIRRDRSLKTQQRGAPQGDAQVRSTFLVPAYLAQSAAGRHRPAKRGGPTWATMRFTPVPPVGTGAP